MEIGWEKLNLGDIEKQIDDNVVKVTGSDLFYSTSIKGLSNEEADLVLTVISAFREHSNDFDTSLIENLIEEYCDSRNLYLEDEQKNRLNDEIKKEIIGFSVLDELTKDKNLEEIAILNEQQPIYVYHKKYGWLQTDLQINDNKKIIDIINKISRKLGRRITLQKPRINANLDFGRIHAVSSPVSFSGTCLTIRKFNEEPFTPLNLIKGNIISSEATAFLWMALNANSNILIVGGTGSGKTSTLNSIFSFVPLEERIIIVEETPEINILHKHKIKLLVNENLDIRMHELVTDTLRMRPDRVIVGEVRNRDETKALMNTMLAGQGKSSFATFHAQNAQEALIRMQSLGINPIDLHALDLIIVQKRWNKNKEEKSSDVRRIIEICTIEKDYEGTPKVVPIFLYNNKKDVLEKKNITENTVYEKICFAFGIEKKSFEKELGKRKHFLEKLKTDEFEEFSKAVNAYV